MKYFRKKSKSNEPEDINNLADQIPNSREQSLSDSSGSANDLSVSLRAEMLPSSNISPDMRKFRTVRFSPRKLVAVLGFVILIGLGWFFYAGPGRPILESVLSSLARQPQTVASATPASVAVAEATAVPTRTVRVPNTPTPTPLPLPSATEAVILDTATSVPSPSPTTASGCVDVLTISTDDVGKTLCVRGVIESFEARESGFLIVFSNQKGAMYWVSYDLVWEPATKGLCVQVIGEVMQIASSPVMVFGYHNLPEICPNP